VNVPKPSASNAITCVLGTGGVAGSARRAQLQVLHGLLQPLHAQDVEGAAP